jgi:hypothetical protein
MRPLRGRFTEPDRYVGWLITIPASFTHTMTAGLRQPYVLHTQGRGDRNRLP